MHFRMSEGFLGALIGAAATILAVPLTVFLTRAADRRDLLRIDRARGALAGQWRGTLEQYDDGMGNVQVVLVEMNLSVRRKRVLGSGHFVAMFKGSEITVNLVFEGGFLHERFLKLEYRNADVAAMQFGTAVLDLMPDGKELIGSYVGFGSINRRIVTGKLTFVKIAGL
jgi:hypothetical protein